MVFAPGFDLNGFPADAAERAVKPGFRVAAPAQARLAIQRFVFSRNHSAATTARGVSSPRSCTGISNDDLKNTELSITADVSSDCHFSNLEATFRHPLAIGGQFAANNSR
jgi:hypothetical protein